MIPCGNGLQNLREKCDDDNTDSGDGCSSLCETEQGWICIGFPSICSVCGDGLIKGGEACDDNNIISNDGCSETCQIEVGFTCNFQPS